MRKRKEKLHGFLRKLNVPTPAKLQKLRSQKNKQTFKYMPDESLSCELFLDVMHQVSDTLHQLHRFISHTLAVKVVLSLVWFLLSLRWNQVKSLCKLKQTQRFLLKEFFTAVLYCGPAWFTCFHRVLFVSKNSEILCFHAEDQTELSDLVRLVSWKQTLTFAVSPEAEQRQHDEQQAGPHHRKQYVCRGRGRPFAGPRF